MHDVEPDLETIADRLERAGHADDSIEGERLRRRVRERLLEETAPAPRIDRYEVCGRLGEGGMGVVYRARDVELGRELAIKLVRRSSGTGRGDIEQARLLSEARALAQLSHPNVVAIFDVGMHAGSVFIAMELVPGVNLRSYAVRTVRSWREILRVYRQAGEGLAAVHDAGLVHRDFKPDNVLFGDDGRVRVADFGLAREHEALDTMPSSDDDIVRPMALTATGKVVGTPAYMAPEQYAGRPADARTDQFSFCVSMWEGLYGIRPMAPDDTRAIAENRVVPRPGRRPVPEWLRAVLLRGLAPDPAQRWPSMRALLSALGRDPTPRRRTVIALGLVLAGTGGIFAAGEIAEARAADECHALADELAPTWNADVAGQVEQRFAELVPAHGSATAGRVRARLDAWTDAWAGAREASCSANAVERTLADDARALRDACLADHAERLGMLLDILREADRDTVNHAIRATLELPPVSECEDDAHLRLADPSARERAREIRRDLSRSILLGAAGRSDEARVVAEGVRRAAVARGDVALEAEASLRIGRAQSAGGDYALAESSFDRAYFAALEAGADEIALDAATQLVYVVGSRLSRFDDALEWSRYAAGLLDRVGARSGFREASLEEQIGNLQRARGDTEAARAALERALALWTEHAGETSPYVAEALGNLGQLLTEIGALEEGERALSRSELLFAAAYGDDSPDVAPVIANRCTNAYARGDLDAALRLCTRTLKIREGALAPDHPSIALALSNLATVEIELERYEDARPLLDRAIAIRRARLGDTHPSVAAALSNLGVAQANLGDLEAALATHREALEIRRDALPAQHPDLATSLLNLADVEVALGDVDGGRTHAEEALGIATAAGAEAIATRARVLLDTDPSDPESPDPPQ